MPGNHQYVPINSEAMDRSAVEGRRGMIWQPIETAPTENYAKAILADCDGGVAEGFLDKGIRGGVEGKKEWVWRYNEKLAWPTHWMPLPPPPEPSATP